MPLTVCAAALTASISFSFFGNSGTEGRGWGGWNPTTLTGIQLKASSRAKRTSSLCLFRIAVIDGGRINPGCESSYSGGSEVER